MPSPFPGMDPYLEGPYWSDFHATFIPCWRRAINDVLPGRYRARIEASSNLIEIDTEEDKVIYPDVAVVFEQLAADRPQRAGGVATLEPVVRTLPSYEEVRERWIEIRSEPDNRLVAVFELLSPWNKAPGAGRGEYLAKRLKILRQDVHLIELDLLLNGLRLPMADSLPPGDYYALVSRSDRRPKCDVYAWKLADRLPSIPIPLLPGDADVLLDLHGVFAATYELAEYDGLIRYNEPPKGNLSETHRALATEIARYAQP